MKINPLYLFIAITTLSSILLFFPVSLQLMEPYLEVDALIVDMDSIRNLPPEDHSKMATILKKGVNLKPFNICLIALTIFLRALGIWTSCKKN